MTEPERIGAINERIEGVLYEFDAIDFHGCATGPWLGWWKARIGSSCDGLWHGCFGDGMWSPQYVTAWRVADVERLRLELARTEGDLGVAIREAASAREALRETRAHLATGHLCYGASQALALVDAALDQRLTQ